MPLVPSDNVLVITYPIVVFLFIRDLKKLHNPGGQVPPIGAIFFNEIQDLAYLSSSNKKCFVVQKLEDISEMAGATNSG